MNGWTERERERCRMNRWIEREMPAEWRMDVERDA